jgi:hypothetical protein
MPCIVPIAPPVGSGFVAGICYPSGRIIFAGQHPEDAEFVHCVENAWRWPTRRAARAAASELIRAFEVREPRFLTPFTIAVEATASR